MNIDEYLKLIKHNWFFNSFDGIIVIPKTAVYKKNNIFDKHDFDYYKTSSKQYLDVINQLIIEANKLNLSQIENILNNSKHLVSKSDIIDKFYVNISNWSGNVKNSDKKTEIATMVNNEVDNLKKNSDISYLRISKMNDNLEIVEREYYTLFAFNGELYLINAIKDRKKELESEIKLKKGKNKRIQRIKDRKTEGRK